MRDANQLVKAMTAVACIDRSWHTAEHEQMKDLLLEGAEMIAKLLREAPQPDDAERTEAQ